MDLNSGSRSRINLTTICLGICLVVSERGIASKKHIDIVKDAPQMAYLFNFCIANAPKKSVYIYLLSNTRLINQIYKFFLETLKFMWISNMNELHSNKFRRFSGKRKVVHVTYDSGIPLIGCIAFGLIDRGTNTIQIRPTSMCPLNCIFCSTDAGPNSKRRQTEYIVELEYLVDEFRRVVRYKGEYKIEAHIDTVGDPLTYPKIVDLVQELKNTKGVEVVSMQTHGYLLSEKLIDDLDDAGLDRLNLSIDSLDPELARYLSGTPTYDVEKIMDMAMYITENKRIDLLIAPVWVPSINDDEIPKIIEFALNIGAGKKWPALGIQKYIPHKRGRKPKGVRPMTWKEFYDKLRIWERKYSTKLVLSLSEDFGLHKRKMLPIKYKIGEKTIVETLTSGWQRGEVLTRGKGVSITVVRMPIIPRKGTQLAVRIIRNKHNIYIARTY